MQMRKLRTFYRVWSGIEEARMRMVSNSIIPVCGSSLALIHDLAINDPYFTSWNFVPAGQMSVGGQSVSAYVILAGNTQLAIDVPGASGASIRLQLFPLHGGANQVWGLVPYLASGSMLSPPFGPVLLVNKSSGLYLGTDYDGFRSNVLQRSYHERSCCWRIDLR